MRRPEDQMRAGHRPAEEVPEGVHPRDVTIIHVHTSPLAPALAILALSSGVCALIWIAAEAADAVVRLVSSGIPIGGGVSLSLMVRRKK
jgi:hypothetical protein